MTSEVYEHYGVSDFDVHDQQQGAQQQSTDQQNSTQREQADKQSAQTDSQTYQVKEPQDYEEVSISPYQAMPLDKLVLQVGAEDLKNILEGAIEARVEARLREAQKQGSLEPFGSAVSLLSPPQHSPQLPHIKTEPVADSQTMFDSHTTQQGYAPKSKASVITCLKDILSDDEEEGEQNDMEDAVPLSSHDELTRCFECDRKHMTPNGLFMHLCQVHPKSDQIHRLKATTWCPMCIVNCRHWYNMAMHVQEIHGKRCWWEERGGKHGSEVQVCTMLDDVMSIRPETPQIKATRGRVRQMSMVEFNETDFWAQQVPQNKFSFEKDVQSEVSPFISSKENPNKAAEQEGQIARKSSFGGFFQQAIKEQSAELWDDEMKSLDARMQQIMDLN